MRIFRAALVIVGLPLAIMTIFHQTDFNPPLPAAHAQAPPDSPPSPTAVDPASSSRAPRYVTLWIKKSLDTLVAGETGQLEIEARLSAPRDAGQTLYRWDREAAAPLTVWIATPDESGITFLDKDHPDRPRHHTLVRFALPPGDDTQPLAAQVEYAINPRTRAGQHTFWLDVNADLVTADGAKLQDTGGLRLPFRIDTHIGTKLLMLLVVAAAVFLFIVEWVRVDVVAIAMMVLLPELGLLNARDTFRGLSSNAVVAIIGVMIISYGLNRAGLVSRIIQPMLRHVGQSSRRLTVMFSGLIALISSVMQNTGAAVLFLPAIRLAASYRLKIPISRVLMPIGMAAILGGTMTMIGTSPLILLNDILPPGMPKFGFLELTPIGVALVLGGIAYLSTIGMRALTGTAGEAQDAAESAGGGFLDTYPLIQGPFEICVPDDYQPGQRLQTVVEIRRRFMVNIVASAQSNGTCEIAPLPETMIRPGFILCAYGPVKAVTKFVADYGLVLRDEPQCFKSNLFNPSLAGIVEGVVSHRSSLIGRTIKEIRFRETFGLNALAIHQSGKTYYRQLADRPLQAGDAILVHGSWEQFHALEDLDQNLIIITPFEKEFHKPEKSGRALTCFLVALALMVLSSFYFQNRPYNPIPLSVCLMLGAVGMVMTRVVTINEAYRAVDWRTVFLLSGLIPLGMAMDQTGTAEWIARGIVLGLGSLMTPLLLLIVLAVLSCGFTMVISNVGACTLLIPLGISIANQIGVDPRVAAIVVGLGVSNSFILPTHQVNALYMGPGGYRTRDYIKIGGGLAFIYIAILVAMTYIFYL
jgi:di/tricarboxylate transporter